MASSSQVTFLQQDLASLSTDRHDVEQALSRFGGNIGGKERGRMIGVIADVPFGKNLLLRDAEQIDRMVRQLCFVRMPLTYASYASCLLRMLHSHTTDARPHGETRDAQTDCRHYAERQTLRKRPTLRKRDRKIA